MKPISKHLFITFLLLVATVFIAGPVSALEIGQPAPDFSLENLQGEPVSLTDFRGRVVLIKLATTWCPTCKDMSAEIDKAANFLNSEDAVVLEVFVQDSVDMVNRYLKGKTFPMTYHALIDDGEAYKAYNVYLIPRLVVVAPDGIVTFDSTGQNVSAQEMQELVSAAGKRSTG